MPLEAESGLGSEWEFENWKNNPYKPDTGNLLSRCCGWCRFASALEVIHPVRLNHCQRGTMRRGRLGRMGPISEEESWKGAAPQEPSLRLTGGRVQTVCQRGGLESHLLGITPGFTAEGLDSRACSAVPKLCIHGRSLAISGSAHPVCKGPVITPTQEGLPRIHVFRRYRNACRVR